MVKNGKPAPDLFLHAAQEMGAEPANCIVIEDSPAGIAAAKAAGMCVFAFTGALTHASPHSVNRSQHLSPISCLTPCRIWFTLCATERAARAQEQRLVDVQITTRNASLPVFGKTGMGN